MTDMIRDNVVVSLAYTLKLADGEVVDQSEADEPLEYLHGASNIIPGLERALMGLHVGDQRQVEVAPEDGYGEYNPDDIEQVERRMLPPEMPLEPGMMLQFADEDGNLMEATVKEIGAQTITLDFNHPLAGKTLFFDVEVVGIREATPEELAHGHPHGLDGEFDEDFDEEDDFEMYLDGAGELDFDEFEDEEEDEDDDPATRRAQYN